MRKIYINEDTESLIKGGVPLLIDKANNSSDIYTPLSDEKIASSLLINGYKDVTSSFEDDIINAPIEKVSLKVSKLSNNIIEKERPIRQQLEQICYNTLVELFNIPEGLLQIELELVDSIDPSRSFHITIDTDEDKEYDSFDDIESENLDVEKRKLSNMIVEGAADYCYSKAKKIFLPEIFEIDDSLPHKYTMFYQLNKYLLYKTNVEITDKEHHQGGYVEVRLGDDTKITKIIVKAVSFPILLHEAIKGLLELVSSNGLPDNMTKAVAVMDKADVLIQEPWNMKMGFPMWKILTFDEDIETKDVPSFIETIVKAPTDEFISLMKEVLYKTKKGKDIIRKLLNHVKHEREYNDFSDDMLKAQKEKLLIDEVEFDDYYI